MNFYDFFFLIFCTNSFAKRFIFPFRYLRMTWIHIAYASSAKFTAGGKIIIRTPPRHSTRLLCDRPRWKAITLHLWEWVRILWMASRLPEILTRRLATKDIKKLTPLWQTRRLLHRPFVSWWVLINLSFLISSLNILKISIFLYRLS